MQSVKKTSDYQIFKKRSGRYCVQSQQRVWINGNDKLQILIKEGLVKVDAPKKKAEEPAAAEAPAETPAE